jgi:dolichol-phosphate mannosyltransferase
MGVSGHTYAGKTADSAGARASASAVEPRGAIRLGIVTPMANEADSAERFVREVLAQCEGFASVRMFVILDGATRDNTRELLEAYARSERRLAVVWAPENRCVVDAYVRGYREALAGGCDWILEIDGGFSHQPADIPKFFAEVGNGYDCIFATRFGLGGHIRNSSLKRRMISRGGTMLSNLMLGTQLTDMTSGFQFFSRDALEMVLERGIRSRAHFFQTEMKFHCRDLKVIEVPIHYQAASPRLKGTAITEALRQLWRLRRDARQRKGSQS